MAGVVVVGSMWGDEGKGKVTDYLAQKLMLLYVMQEETMQDIQLCMMERNLH